MKTRKWRHFRMLLVALSLSACATVSDNPIASPDVNLRNVQVVGFGFKSQTFLLSFDIANPNPFPLPIRNVGYRIRLDGQYFAGGETASDFTVPANGDASFAISVELDLMRTSPQLLSLVRSGSGRDVRYDLDGRFGIDVPLVPEVSYRHSGNIRLGAGGF